MAAGGRCETRSHHLQGKKLFDVTGVLKGLISQHISREELLRGEKKGEKRQEHFPKGRDKVLASLRTTREGKNFIDSEIQSRKRKIVKESSDSSSFGTSPRKNKT